VLPALPHRDLAEHSATLPDTHTNMASIPDILLKPLRWASPRAIFLNRVIDQFQSAGSDDCIKAVTMAQVLTKSKRHANHRLEHLQAKGIKAAAVPADLSDPNTARDLVSFVRP
jgi:protein gp37